MRIITSIGTCKQRLYGLLCVLALCVGTVAVAGEVRDLYEVQIPVINQGESERRDAVHEALVEVLIKVTGNRQVASLPALETALTRPMRFVQQYRYRPLDTDAGREEPTGGSQLPYTQQLWVTFDPEAVHRLLQEAGVPVWGRTRPTTLLWVAVEEADVRYLLGGDAHRELQMLIKREAQRRGIPVLLPLLDLEDQARVRFSDIWGNFQDTVLGASERYQPGAVLVGRILRSPHGGWTGRWSLYQSGQAEHWAGAGAQVAEILAAGVDGGADHLGARYAQVISADTAQALELQVTDVVDLDDYARVMRYLQSLDPVAAVDVAQVADSSMRVQVKVRGARDSLVQVIDFGNTLVAAPVAGSMDSDPADPSLADSGSASAPQPAALTYRLLP